MAHIWWIWDPAFGWTLLASASVERKVAGCRVIEGQMVKGTRVKARAAAWTHCVGVGEFGKGRDHFP